MELFFPGVQHTGIERSVITGSAFLKPVGGWLASSFGYRRDPFTDEMHFHRGVDLAAPAGTPVRAALDGWVAVVGFDPVLGNYVLIRHQINYSTVYGHLSQVWVSRGTTVSRGQRIGAVGNTGKSTGPHLHFEIRRRGVPVNAWGLMTSRY
jgi:murein DD-endopeptidase MepM/ murein hydrolase activator NlpD